MKTLRFLLPLLILPLVAAHAQEIEPPDGTPIAFARVSGLDIHRLSTALMEDIAGLAGTPLNRSRLTAIAARIETEQPEYVAAVRTSQESNGTVRVVFVIARLRDQERAANINSRYVVEDVRVQGVREDALETALRADMHALAGRQLDPDAADRIEARLRAALPRYDVRRRIVRGSAPGRITLVFDVQQPEWVRWLRFEPQDANLVYHSDQGWGARLPLTLAGRDFQIMPILAFDIGDELAEEYSGVGVRFETRRLGTERLGAFFEWTTFNPSWRDATLASVAANAAVPAPYRNRMSVTPLVKFAITREVTLAGGVSITELDPLDDGAASRMANAVVGSLSFSRRSRDASPPAHLVDAAAVVHAGTASLQSDLVYQRYLANAAYTFRQAKHTVIVSGMAGAIAGDAPLFERFTLGDSRTLRGWNKYDIAPAGGDRMFHASVEYRYRGWGLFFDTGSLWNDGESRRLRAASGVTFNTGAAFFTLGFPLNTDEFRAVFTMGIRVSNAPVSVSKH